MQTRKWDHLGIQLSGGGGKIYSIINWSETRFGEGAEINYGDYGINHLLGRL
jgi:hypothetical protein